MSPTTKDERMTMTPIVYVSQVIRGLDYRDLEERGEIVFLMEDEYPREPSNPYDRDIIVGEAFIKLGGYRPGVDFIALTPSPMSSMIAGMVIGRVTGDHKILKWNNRRMDYDDLIVSVLPDLI